MSVKLKIPDVMPQPAAELWIFLRDALDALEEVRQMDGYRIYMGFWHWYDENSDTCWVCLAGAWLVRHTESDRQQEAAGIPRKHPLQVLDHLRSGELGTAIAIWNELYPEAAMPAWFPSRINCPYGNSPTRFMEDMRAIVDLLRQHTPVR